MWSPAAPLPYLLLYLFFFFVRPHEYPEWKIDFPFMPTLLILGFLTALLQQREPAAPKYGILLIALSISIFISIAKMGWISGAIEALSKFAPAALLGFVASRSIESIAHFRILAIALTLVGGFLGVYGIDQVAQEISWSGVTLLAGRIRYLGLLADPNDMANIMLVSLSMAIYLALGKGSMLTTRMISIACIFVILWGIVLTESRGAFVGIAMMIMVYFTVQRRNWKILLLAPILITALLALLPERFSAEDQTAESSSAGRIFAWSVGLNLLQSNPIFGVGYGQFVDYNRLTAHNSFVLAFAELGLVGYLIWVAMLSLALFTSWRIQSSRTETLTTDTSKISQIVLNQEAAQALFYGLIGLLTTAFFLSRTYMSAIYFMVGMAVGLYGLASRIDSRLMPINMRTFMVQTSCLGIGFVFLIYIIVRLGTMRFVQ
jgi:putative inorganic carbon (HCO3(-)) transporter